MKFIVDTTRTSVEQPSSAGAAARDYRSPFKSNAENARIAAYRAEGVAFREYIQRNPKLQKQLQDILDLI